MAGHGGARAGAGRPKGVRGLARRILEGTPGATASIEYSKGHSVPAVAFMLGVMAKEDLPIGLRLQAALGAAQYTAPKLSANLHAHVPAAPSSDAKARLEQLLERLAAPTIDLQPVIDASNVVELKQSK
jgi:hypothetical protein